MIIGLLSALSSTYGMEANRWGAGVMLPLCTIDPEDLHGYRLSLLYEPTSLTGSYAKFYLDTSFGHWWVDEIPTFVPAKKAINIYAIAPVARFFYANKTSFTPFIDMSIGLSYLSETRIDRRNLGMHFAFQDLLAFGVSYGKKKELSVSLGAIHYSNANLADRNSGITIPLIVNVGYRF